MSETIHNYPLCWKRSTLEYTPQQEAGNCIENDSYISMNTRILRLSSKKFIFAEENDSTTTRPAVTERCAPI